MENPQGKSNEHETACARIAAHFSRPALRHYVRSKLRSDPVYQAVYKILHGSNNSLFDIGCGVGLLAFYLRERNCSQPIISIDIDARKIERAKTVAAASYLNVEFRGHAAEQIPANFSGDIVLLDLLHYLPLEEQKSLLKSLATRVAPGGHLIIRDSPRDRTARYWITFLAEKFAQAISWNWKAPLHFPSEPELNEPFDESEFERTSRSLWGQTPFNNHIFIFRRR